MLALESRQIVLSCLVALAGCQVAASSPPVYGNAALPTLKVESASAGCSVKLEMSLTNSTAATMTLDRSALPWTENFSGIRLAIHRASEDHELIKRIVGVDHPDGEINLQPGQTITGSITVNDSYPDLGNVLQNSDLQLSWKFVSKKSNGTPKKIEQGVFKLNRCSPIPNPQP